MGLEIWTRPNITSASSVPPDLELEPRNLSRPQGNFCPSAPEQAAAGPTPDTLCTSWTSRRLSQPGISGDSSLFYGGQPKEGPHGTCLPEPPGK